MTYAKHYDSNYKADDDIRTKPIHDCLSHPSRKRVFFRVVLVCAIVIGIRFFLSVRFLVLFL